MRRTRPPVRAAGPTGGDRRRSGTIWFDPRFAIGLVLVVLSVAGVSAVVAAAGASVDVLAARHVLTPGEHVTVADFLPTSVRAGGVAGVYLQAKDVPSGGVIVRRTMGAGELAPRSAVGSAGGAQLSSVVVTIGGAVASPVTAGARVDVWVSVPAAEAQVAGGHAPQSGGGASFDAPTVLVPSAIVVRVLDQKPLVATGTSTSLELLVPKASTADVLDAIANGAALSVVPVDLPLGQ